MKAYIQAKREAQRHPHKLLQSKSSAGDILDLALQDAEYGATASTSELLDQLKTFLFAGHDTTAATICWAFYFLSQHSESLSRLRKELDDVFGVNTSPKQVAEMLIAEPKLHSKLEFALAVIKESLRLEPPAAPAREATANYRFTTHSGQTFDPPEGVMMYLSAWMLHRNKDVWGQDAEEFRPQRFMSGNPVPWGYLAFSKRPRDCIGSSLAYLEVYCNRHRANVRRK